MPESINDPCNELGLIGRCNDPDFPTYEFDPRTPPPDVGKFPSFLPVLFKEVGLELDPFEPMNDPFMVDPG